MCLPVGTFRNELFYVTGPWTFPQFSFSFADASNTDQSSLGQILPSFSTVSVRPARSHHKVHVYKVLSDTEVHYLLVSFIQNVGKWFITTITNPPRLIIFLQKSQLQKVDFWTTYNTPELLEKKWLDYNHHTQLTTCSRRVLFGPLTAYPRRALYFKVDHRTKFIFFT